jgi:exportin-2 (importin alpha re-exporter)
LVCLSFCFFLLLSLSRNRPAAFASLAHLFHGPQALSQSSSDNDASGVTSIDIEEQSAGYQAAYSRLAAADLAPIDPAAHIPDVRIFARERFAQFAQSEPRARALIDAARPNAPQTVIEPFLRELGI